MSTYSLFNLIAALQVWMKPGKPLTFAEIIAKPMEDVPRKKILAFGLPGNPVSCLVCFNLFVVPTIRHLAGWANPHLLRLLYALFLYPIATAETL